MEKFVQRTNFFNSFFLPSSSSLVPKRYLSSVVRQFLRAVRSVLPRPVEEGEALQHYSISPGMFSLDDRVSPPLLFFFDNDFFYFF